MQNNPQRPTRLENILKYHNLHKSLKTVDGLIQKPDDAAERLGCKESQVIRSIVFDSLIIKEPIIVLLAGTNRVDLERVGDKTQIIAFPTSMETILEWTGYPIGAMPPFGHKELFLTLIDPEIMTHRKVWASAGSANTYFSIDPVALHKITGGLIMDITDMR